MVTEPGASVFVTVTVTVWPAPTMNAPEGSIVGGLNVAPGGRAGPGDLDVVDVRGARAGDREVEHGRLRARRGGLLYLDAARGEGVDEVDDRGARGPDRDRERMRHGVRQLEARRRDRFRHVAGRARRPAHRYEHSRRVNHRAAGEGV